MVVEMSGHADMSRGLGSTQGGRSASATVKREATFFHDGLLLEAGFGDHFDEWRASELWKLYESGVHFQKDRDMECLVDYVASRRRWSDLGPAPNT